MRYTPPFGMESTPNASYINGDPSQGIMGSIPPAEVFESPQRELVNLITFSGVVPNASDLQQLTQAVRSQFINYAEDTSAVVNSITVAYDPPLGSYTRGLVLRVRVRNTNTGAARINAGAGTRAIRRMNNSDVAEGELAAGAIATLVFDGTNFQLSNFGGGGGGGPPTLNVRIPYSVDQTPYNAADGSNIVTVNEPLLGALAAGEMVAVKINNNNSGYAIMRLNGADIPLRPNGGGGLGALQGDLRRGDVVLFVYDGVNFWFSPNPEITRWVGYTIAAGGHFATITEALAALKRKTIGADGYVVLYLNEGTVNGPIEVDHPSADRLQIRGVWSSVHGPEPVPSSDNQFWMNFDSQHNLEMAATNNRTWLTQRYLTRIKVAERVGTNHACGISNIGPGSPSFVNLLIMGDRYYWPSGQEWWSQSGAFIAAGKSIECHNVVAWGCERGFAISGPAHFYCTYATACTGAGFAITLAGCFYNSIAAFSNENEGIGTSSGGTLYGDNCVVRGNRLNLTASWSTSQTHWRVINDSARSGGLCATATGNSTLVFIKPRNLNYNSVSPPVDASGWNLNGIITVVS